MVDKECTVRRNLLRTLAMLPLLSTGFAGMVGAFARAVAPTPTRRVRPSDSSWPSPASWAKLRDDVGGNLIEVRPPVRIVREGTEWRGLPRRAQEY
jgi:hypothetical protein